MLLAALYFYFATRYENTIATYPFDMFNGTSNQVFTTAFLNMLKTWHANDPVSAREIARNNAIYARQGNRNPYIDPKDPRHTCARRARAASAGPAGKAGRLLGGPKRSGAS